MKKTDIKKLNKIVKVIGITREDLSVLEDEDQYSLYFRELGKRTLLMMSVFLNEDWTTDMIGVSATIPKEYFDTSKNFEKLLLVEEDENTVTLSLPCEMEIRFEEFEKNYRRKANKVIEEFENEIQKIFV